MICLESMSMGSRSRNTDKTMSPSFQPQPMPPASSLPMEGRRDREQREERGGVREPSNSPESGGKPAPAPEPTAEPAGEVVPALRVPTEGVLECPADPTGDVGPCECELLVVPAAAVAGGSELTGQTIFSSKKGLPALVPTDSPTNTRFSSPFGPPARRALGSGGRYVSRLSSS